MLSIKNITLNLVLSFLSLVSMQAQDSLDTQDLLKISYNFTIVDGELRGEGARMLESNIAASQYTMIGEYHGSKLISEFTKALIPVCDANNYKLMALEVGPISANKLAELSAESENTASNLKVFNQKYYYPTEEFTAIPFFEHVEDADFLAEASKRSWKLIGVDQEFSYSYEMLINRMFENLSVEKQKAVNKNYRMVRDTIAHFIGLDDSQKRRFSISATESIFLQDFLDEMSIEEINEEIVDAFRETVKIYKYNADRKWFENNESRITYMKSNLRKGMKQNNFDISKDKMLIKMGGYHLSKGKSPLGFYELGNTLNELAEFHGNKALNISFIGRYYMEEGTLIDELEENPNYNLKELALLAKKDEWVVIDLRQLIKGIEYHPVQYKVTEAMRVIMSRYDLIVLPPIEMEATKNY